MQPLAHFLPKGTYAKNADPVSTKKKVESKGVRQRQDLFETYPGDIVTLTGQENASISVTLAAAYAEAGRFPNAVTTARARFAACYRSGQHGISRGHSRTDQTLSVRVSLSL